jgi:hypothetical protein
VVSFLPRPFYPPGERAPVIHVIGGSVDPRAGLKEVEEREFLTLPGLEMQTLRRRAHSQSLHRLRYPGSIYAGVKRNNNVARRPLVRQRS